MSSVDDSTIRRFDERKLTPLRLNLSSPRSSFSQIREAQVAAKLKQEVVVLDQRLAELDVNMEYRMSYLTDRFAYSEPLWQFVVWLRQILVSAQR